MSTLEELTARLNAISLPDRLVGLLTPASGLCNLCRGSGHLLCYQDGEREFWKCPACGGNGARALYSPPTIHAHAMKGQK